MIKIYKNKTKKEYLMIILLIFLNIICLYLFTNINFHLFGQHQEELQYFTNIKEMFSSKQFNDINSFENDDFIVSVNTVSAKKIVMVFDKKEYPSIDNTTELIIENKEPITPIILKKISKTYSQISLFSNFCISFLAIAAIEFIITLFFFSFDKKACILISKILLPGIFFIIMILFSTHLSIIVNIPLISFLLYIVLITPIYLAKF